MTQTQQKILIVEDEPEIRRFLRVSLAEHGYLPLEAAEGELGIAMAASEKPDLIILDLGLPDIDGTEVAQRIREWSAVPIIVLSCRGQETDKVAALDMGADDYLTKPFGVQELLARMRVALRNCAARSDSCYETIFTAGKLRVDISKHLVFVDDVEVHLTPIEYKLLQELIKNAGGLVTQQSLLRNVWGPGYAKEGHYLRVYMGALRRKLEEDPAQPQYLITEPGVGYRLKVN